MPDISQFPGYPTYSQYSPQGRDFGNPLVNAGVFAAFGNNYAPRPGSQQDYTDAEMQRLGSREFMGLQGSAFSSNMLFKQAGFNPENNMLQFAGKAFASPDSAVSRMLSPLIGGNPMAATQQLYAGLQGANIMGAFGRPEGVSASETKDMMKILEKSFYKQQGMDDTVDRHTGMPTKGVTSEMNAEFSQMLIGDPTLATELGIGAASKAESDKFKATGAARKTGTEAMFSAADKLDANELKRGTKDFDEKLSKSLNKHLEEVLVKAHKITEEELKNSRDGNGMLKRDVVNKIGNAELSRAEVESAGLDYNKVKGAKLSDIADKIHASRLDRDVRLNVINQSRLVSDKASEEIENLESKSNKTKADAAKIKELKQVRSDSYETIKQHLITASGGKITEKEIDDHTSGGGILGFGKKNRKIDVDYLNSKEAELNEKSRGEYKADQYRKYREAGGRYAGINFENTRGFNMEDFTSSYKSAAELNLLGGKGSVTQKFEGFMQNSGGALSAARGVFGDKPAGQLVGNISDLIGSKAGDMSTEQGSGEIEKFLRDMKATARVAGVSMNAMLDTIDAAKALAKNNPRLQYMSGAATSDMTVKAFQTVAGMSGVMGSGDMRRAGGTQGMVAAHISEQQKLISSDMGQSLIALRQRFAGDPNKQAALERALAKYDKTGVNGKDIPNLLTDILKEPEMQGESRGSLMNSMNNTALREMGMKNDGFVKKTGEMMNKGFEGAMYTHLFNNTKVELNREGFAEAYAEAKGKTPGLSENAFKAEYTKKQLADQYKEAKKKNDEARKKDPNVAELTFDDFMSSAIGKDPYATNVYNQMRQTVQEGIMREVNPEYFKNLDKKRTNDARLDAELDKKFGGRNAPIITQLVSEISAGGKFDKAKTERLLQIFGTSSGYSEKQSAALSAGFGVAIDAAGTEDYKNTARGLSQATGESVSESDLKNMATAGFVGADNVEEAKKRLETLQDKKKKGTLEGTEKLQLKALEDEKKLGLLSSSKAYDTAKDALGKGHDASAITAGVIEGQKDKKNLEYTEKMKQEMLHGGKDAQGNETMGLDQLLSKAATDSKDEEQQKAIKALRDTYGTDDEKMIADEKAGVGIFDKDSDAAKKAGVDFSKDKFGTIRESIKETGTKITEMEEKATGGKAADKDKDGVGDVADQLKALTKGLNDSKLTTALVQIAGKV